jgi:hypothetical protein
MRLMSTCLVPSRSVAGRVLTMDGPLLVLFQSPQDK